MAHDWIPRIAAIGRCVNLTSGGAEIDAAGIERIDRHGVAQHVHVAIALRQTFSEFFPFVAAGAAAIDAQFAVGREMFGVALDRDDVNGFRFVRMNVNRESEIARQISAHFVPRISCVVAPHDVPVFLHEKRLRFGRMHRDAMHAVPYLCRWIGHELRVQTSIDWLPRFAAVITTKGARGGDCDGYSSRILLIEENRVQTHSACARLPLRAGIVFAQSR